MLITMCLTEPLGEEFDSLTKKSASISEWYDKTVLTVWFRNLKGGGAKRLIV